MEEQLVRDIEVANLMGVRVSTLRKWRVLRKGPPFRRLAGRAVRYDLALCRAWLAAQPAGGDRPISAKSNTKDSIRELAPIAGIRR